MTVHEYFEAAFNEPLDLNYHEGSDPVPKIPLVSTCGIECRATIDAALNLRRFLEASIGPEHLYCADICTITRHAVTTFING